MIQQCSGNENVKNTTGVISKLTTLHMRQPDFFFSLPSLDYLKYNVKIPVPNFTFYGSSNKILFLFLNLDMIPWHST